MLPFVSVRWPPSARQGRHKKPLSTAVDRLRRTLVSFIILFFCQILCKVAMLRSDSCTTCQPQKILRQSQRVLCWPECVLCWCLRWSSFREKGPLSASAVINLKWSSESYLKASVGVTYALSNKHPLVGKSFINWRGYLLLEYLSAAMRVFFTGRPENTLCMCV